MRINLGGIDQYDADEFPGRISGCLEIGVTSFHVEAIEVDEATGSKAVNPDLQDRIDRVSEFDGGDCGKGYETVKHKGRHYFVVIFPFQK